MQEMAKIITSQMQTKITNYVDSTILPPLLTLKNTFQSVGNGLKNDIQVLINQGANMTDTMKTEMDNIKTTFVAFGTNIKNGAVNIANGVKEVATQMTDAVAEIKPSIKAAAYETSLILPRLQAFNPIGAGWAAYEALAILLFKKPKSAIATGGAVLPEMMEAYNQIGAAFTGLKNNFSSFGNIIKNQSTNIGNQIGTSTTNIKNSTNAFLLSFKGVFDNMSERIKGGTAKVLKQIEVAKALPPTPIGVSPTAPTVIPPEEVLIQPAPARIGGLQEFEEQQAIVQAPAPVQEPAPAPARIGGLQEFGEQPSRRWKKKPLPKKRRVRNGQ